MKSVVYKKNNNNKYKKINKIKPSKKKNLFVSKTKYQLTIYSYLFYSLNPGIFHTYMYSYIFLYTWNWINWIVEQFDGGYFILFIFFSCENSIITCIMSCILISLDLSVVTWWWLLFVFVKYCHKNHVVSVVFSHDMVHDVVNDDVVHDIYSWHCARCDIYQQ